ncbi:PPK2 family polyphosphate kinase [Sulfuriroseicoccus oceanibius]|uniref:Deoxynucleoside kinase n=1 Tax=Sulfuriroseicoccus oceanibius TaxID=2707525 RepID=A0A6B3LES8_9BACT|nr:PPK2 family polyphosphate kinase [Sulfuriroseicoccus oceanibius]QQL45003.1 deoxynucleoside kinase [Sulfuriroseicoccus oceanibius]
MKRYLVKPGSKVNLSKVPTKDDSMFPDESKETHLVKLDELRQSMQDHQHKFMAAASHKFLVIIQAMDTGGKDGTVRHVFAKIDPAGIRVVPFKKPSEEELAHDYLWRVHKEAPANGEMVVFNRSHYEDIVAVQVKNLAPERVWKKRYDHINNFEKMLADEGTKIVKIFLHISKDEQAERLRKRLENPEKRWKFNLDDLEDRQRWDEFQKAYEVLIEKTSTDHAPWHIIPADRKWYRNMVVSKLISDELEELEVELPKLSFDPSQIVIED